jgi:hypothetical protein
VECPPTRAQAWLDDHERDLEGLAAEEAAAMVEGAGLHVRVLQRSGGWLPQELRDDRITLRLDERGGVQSSEAG